MVKYCIHFAYQNNIADVKKNVTRTHGDMIQESQRSFKKGIDILCFMMLPYVFRSLKQHRNKIGFKKNIRVMKCAGESPVNLNRCILKLIPKNICINERFTAKA